MKKLLIVILALTLAACANSSLPSCSSVGKEYKSCMTLHNSDYMCKKYKPSSN